MELHRITLLSLLLCMAYVPYAVNGATETIHGKVGEKIQLKCPSGEKKTSEYRGWYRGNYNADNKPPDTMKLVRGKDGNFPKTKLFRDDMELDVNTFTLTLTVQNDGSDNDWFTCLTDVEPQLFDVTQVSIFLQPVVKIESSPEPAEGINVTVACTVERLYPNITNSQFKMKWSGQQTYETEFSGFPNDDGSMKYTLVRSKNLTQADSGVMVECTVTPTSNFGDPHSANLTLDFDTGTTIPPNGASLLGATIGSLISGLAAFIIVVTISGTRIA